MAITSNFYPSSFASMFNGTLNDGDTFKCALLSSSGSFDGSHTTFSDLSGSQVSGSGYTAGGATVTLGATSDGTKTEFAIGAASWSNVTVSFSNAVIYSEDSGDLMLHLAWPYEESVSGLDYQINAPSPAPSVTPN